VSLLLIVLIAKGLIEHLSYLHHNVQVLVGQNVTQIDDSVITDDACEVHLFSICLNSNNRREDE